MEINDYGPIADLYDIYVPATFDIPFFIHETKKSTGEVLELRAGTGRVSLPLVEAGVKLTCIDSSAEMVILLRKKLEQRGLQAEVQQMDIRELRFSRQFDMVIIPFHSFTHLTSLDDQHKALEGIRRCLAPRGKFICTLGNPAMREKSIDGQLRLYSQYPLNDGRGKLLLWIQENFDPDDHQVVDALEFFEEYDEKGSLKSKRLMELHFRLLRKSEFEEQARACGLAVTAVYGDYSYAEYNEESSPFTILILEPAG